MTRSGGVRVVVSLDQGGPDRYGLDHDRFGSDGAEDMNDRLQGLQDDITQMSVPARRSP